MTDQDIIKAADQIKTVAAEISCLMEMKSNVPAAYNIGTLSDHLRGNNAGLSREAAKSLLQQSICDGIDGAIAAARGVLFAIAKSMGDDSTPPVADQPDAGESQPRGTD